jgi:hypothetical protein
MDGANSGQVKELKRIVEFVSQTKDKGLLMHFRNEDPYKIEVYSDSDFGEDKDGRKSASGIIS